MSTTKTMLMTEALRERKLLKDRFTKITRDGLFVSYTKGDDKKPTSKIYKSSEELESKIISSRQSAEALLANYRKLVAAIVESNAKTMVTIGNVEMTVAAAIEYRNSVSMERSLLTNMKTQLSNNAVAAQRDQVVLDADIERRVQGMKTEAMSADDVAKLLEDTKARFYKESQPVVFDPTNVAKRIEELENSLQDFDVALETSLNISNATTSITVEYV